ncbi:histidine kinase dimerization/phospho-acceptor domain-containing protein [Bacillus sp. CGMCC 1.60114]|uniref:histidine kinase dimerization/phospho-acceptor domain-containing protein n=1 Tax=unclassified Bacillus (in: firmicutes) TaxID=185979 RepID=UPI003627D2DC
MLFQEERKSAKLFLWVFNFSYIILQGPHIKTINCNINTIKFIVNFGLSTLMLLLLLLGIYCVKKEIPHAVKYVYLIGYLFGDTFLNVWIYWRDAAELGSGNFVEVVLTFFVPIFMSKRYFWTLIISLIIKYSVIIVVSQQPKALMTMIVSAVVLGVSYILLMRFYSYIEGINKVFKKTKQNQQSAVIGEMAATIGHEIRNPLTSLKGFTQLQKEKYPNDPIYHNMIQEIERINGIISELMILARPKSKQYGTYNVRQLLSDVINVEERNIRESEIKVNYIFDANVPNIECDAKQIKYVFVHIMKYVMETMEQGNTINICIQTIKEKFVVIYIADKEYVINEKKAITVGEVSFTSKEDEIDLGLMAVYKIMDEHQGHIHFDYVANVGIRIEAILPIKQ